MKKKLIGCGCIVFIFFLYFNYRIMNIYDELYLASGKIIPYTRANFLYFDAKFAGPDELSHIEANNRFVYEVNDTMKVIVTVYKNKIVMTCMSMELNYVKVRFELIYYPWTKQIYPYLLVFECANGDEPDYTTPIEDENKIAELLEKSNTTIENVYEDMFQITDMVLDKWIESNKGKTKFSKRNHGIYRIMPIQYVY